MNIIMMMRVIKDNNIIGDNHNDINNDEWEMEKNIFYYLWCILYLKIKMKNYSII